MPDPDDAFFEPLGNDRYAASERTRGPWHPDFQHGGPPAALLGHAIEARMAADGAGDSQLARVTVEFLRPVPIAELRTTVRPVHRGRKVQTYAAELHAGNKLVATAAALAMRQSPVELGEIADRDAAGGAPRPAPPDACPERPFPFFGQDVGYHTSMETRFAAGDFQFGPATVWFRMRIAVLPGVAPSPWQRVLCAADSGNGISFVVDMRRVAFMNPDLMVALHRPPRGDWVALQAETVVQPNGLGLATTVLHDADGPIGRGAQTLLIDPVG